MSKTVGIGFFPLAPVIVIAAFNLMRGGGSAPEEILWEFEFFHKDGCECVSLIHSIVSRGKKKTGPRLVQARSCEFFGWRGLGHSLDDPPPPSHPSALHPSGYPFCSKSRMILFTSDPTSRRTVSVGQEFSLELMSTTRVPIRPGS